jgi:hypothetical protein
MEEDNSIAKDIAMMKEELQLLRIELKNKDSKI